MKCIREDEIWVVEYLDIFARLVKEQYFRFVSGE